MMRGFNRGWDGGSYGTTYCDLAKAGLWIITIIIILILLGTLCLSC